MSELDKFKKSYQESFRFNDENHIMLRRCGAKISAKIAIQGSLNILSLGIGHRVVSSMILEKIKGTDKYYTIVEGSSDIIRDFEESVNLPANVSLVHDYFEDFESDYDFDIIDMGFILEHVDDPLSILKRYRTMLSGTGSMMIAVPNALSLHRVLGVEAGLLQDPYSLSDHDLMLGHKHYFDLKQLTGMIKEAKLTISSVEGIYLKPFTTSQISSLELSEKVYDALVTVGVKYPELANAIFVEATR